MSTSQLLDAFYSNIAATLDGNEELVSPGVDGLHAVELANAILLSSATGKAIKLPLCREDYRRFIEEKLDLTAQAN